MKEEGRGGEAAAVEWARRVTGGGESAFAHSFEFLYCNL